MISTNNEKSEILIKLTRAELMSQHVDELLQRQMNLRGERGRIETKRTWYYQNWFIFMVVGCIAAILAWAIIEPYFDDVYYIQGKIEEVQLFNSFKNEQTIEISPSDSFNFIGRIRIREDWIGISYATGTIEKGIQKNILSPGNLEVNREIGVYVDYVKDNKQSLPVALFVSFTTNPHAPEKAYMSLSKLNSRKTAASFLLFSLVAGFIGLAIGAVDGIICRVFKRALIGGVVGFFIGFIGGFFSTILGGIVYQPLNTLAMKQLTDNMSLSTLGFLIQIIARTLAWG